MDFDAAIPSEVTYFNGLDSPNDLQRPEVERQGTAMAVATGRMANQPTLDSFRGNALLNSYGSGGDTSVGSVTFTIPVRVGSTYLLTYLVGGGDCARGRVSVPAYGFTSCGRMSESLHQEAYVFAAKSPTLRINVVDDGRGGFGHILFDDLILWQISNADPATLVHK